MTSKDIKKECFGSRDEFIKVWTDVYGYYDPKLVYLGHRVQYIGTTETFKEKTLGCMVGNRPKGVGPTRTHSELGS